jgi:hypothetical protein
MLMYSFKLFRRVSMRLYALIMVVMIVPVAVSGCRTAGNTGLDADDLRFAGFYSDYLVESGVTSSDEDVVLAPLSSEKMNSMLARHDLKPEDFRKKVRLYNQEPERWKLVIALVRSNVQKETP